MFFKFRGHVHIQHTWGHQQVSEALQEGVKRAAIELWRAKVPLKPIRKQLGMSESTWNRIQVFASQTLHNLFFRGNQEKLLRSLGPPRWKWIGRSGSTPASQPSS
jgi:hypothetical protein